MSTSFEKPVKDEKQQQDQKARATLILWNDEVNTFDWVIESLIKVCDHSTTQAEQCALIAHFNGKAEIKTGAEEKLKAMKNDLTERGISATIEKVNA